MQKLIKNQHNDVHHFSSSSLGLAFLVALFGISACGTSSSEVVDTDPKGKSAGNQAFTCKSPQVGDRQEVRMEFGHVSARNEPGQDPETGSTVYASRQEVLSVQGEAVTKLKILVLESKNKNFYDGETHEEVSKNVGQAFLVAWMGRYFEVQSLDGTRMEGNEGQRDWEDVKAIAHFRQDVGKPSPLHLALNGYAPRVGPVPEAQKKALLAWLKFGEKDSDDEKLVIYATVKEILPGAHGPTVVFQFEFKTPVDRKADPVQVQRTIELRIQLTGCAFLEMKMRDETHVEGKSQGISTGQITHSY